MMKILLYGNSLALTGLAACLQSVEGFEVTQKTNGGALGSWTDLPDMVIVDMARWSSPVARRCVQRNVRLLGVDADNGTVTVFSGKSFSASSMQEVAQLLAAVCRAKTMELVTNQAAK